MSGKSAKRGWKNCSAAVDSAAMALSEEMVRKVRTKAKFLGETDSEDSVLRSENKAESVDDIVRNEVVDVIDGSVDIDGVEEVRVGSCDPNENV